MVEVKADPLGTAVSFAGRFSHNNLPSNAITQPLFALLVELYLKTENGTLALKYWSRLEDEEVKGKFSPDLKHLLAATIQKEKDRQGEETN